MKTSLIIFLLFILAFILKGFSGDNPYFNISEKDIIFNIPEGFPKPKYDLKKNKITIDGFLLGRKLFYDPILAKDNFTSCSTCHQPFAAFAHIDHAISHGIHGQIGKRNVPALQNLVWKDEFMADGGINHLDLQPIAPISNPIEMGETLENVISKLQNDSVYPGLFKKAFGDSLVTTQKLVKSLSQFLALMITSNSRYDKYIKGTEKFTDQEINGLKLFRAKCEGCHKEPMFTDLSYRDNGLKFDAALNDSGRYLITGVQNDFMKFKVPGLRNIQMTYPYMHDGRFNKLEEVMDHYGEGKFISKNTDVNINKITGLSPEQKLDLIAFLRTLTDRTFLYDRRFMDPNFRK